MEIKHKGSQDISFESGKIIEDTHFEIEDVILKVLKDYTPIFKDFVMLE